MYIPLFAITGATLLSALFTGIALFTNHWAVITVFIDYSIYWLGLVPYNEMDPGWIKATCIFMYINFTFEIIAIIICVIGILLSSARGDTKFLRVILMAIAAVSALIGILGAIAFIIFVANYQYLDVYDYFENPIDISLLDVSILVVFTIRSFTTATMRKGLFLFCAILSIGISKKLKVKTDGYTTDDKSDLFCIWNQTAGWKLPYQSLSIECCDSQLNSVLREAVRIGINTPKLGDAAKFIQRRAHLRFKKSFEVIVSKRNFAISRHYHGSHSCKIMDHKHIFLIYETPRQYDPFDMPKEDYLSTIDSGDPLGSEKPANLRGDFPDVREDSTAGEDLSVQPPIDAILSFPNKFAEVDPDEEMSKAAFLMAEEQSSMDDFLNPVTEISVLSSETNSTEMFNSFANLREKDRLPENTHCDKKRKDGNRCCDGRLASTMRDAMRQMATSAEFGIGKEGIIASELQQKVQLRFKKSFEVIVSRSDFVLSSYMNGDNICKFENRGFYILAYATPRQYDIEDSEHEKELSETSDPDPLGSSKPSFANEAPWHVPLKLEFSGPRAGYPVGSHCSESRTGSRCCNLILFNAMKTGYEKVINSAKFDPYDLREITKEIQWNVEEVLQHSAEVIVSLDDFTYATHNTNEYTCKYRVDKYYVLAYTTPEGDTDYEYDENDVSIIPSEPEANIVQPVLQENIETRQGFNQQQTAAPQTTVSYFSANPQPMYPHVYQPMFHNPMLQQNPVAFGRFKRQIGPTPYPIHSSPYNDIGSAKPFHCPAELSGLDGIACCDGGLQYEANKVIDQAKQAPDFDKHNTRNLAKLMTRSIQKRFGTTFESVVAEADFTWGTNKFNQRSCKIDSNGYSALSYQSSSKPPPATDFLDIPNDPTLGGPTGASGAGGGGGGNGGGAGGGGGGGNAGGGGGGSGGAGGGRGNGGGGGGGSGAAASGGGGSGSGGGAAGSAGGGAGNGAGAAGSAGGGAGNGAGAAGSAGGGAGNGAGGGAGNGAAAAAAANAFGFGGGGKKRMDQIDIGDYVLTANHNSTYFTPITLWIHREPETVEKFVTIMTEYGKMLRLTSRHYMYRNKCGKNYQEYIKLLPAESEAVFASTLEVNDCVIVMYKGRYRQQKIQEITITERKGIYSPLTSNGRIIVNDMLASCYSDLKQSTIQTTYFWAANLFRTKISELFGNLFHNKIELPSGTMLTKEIIQLIVPIRK
ncbi:unnamed protein product [Caenorhabditis bovis]|uniref:Ground-like domain-containing protein n=1 Tax=Caenorhabditis bovis TaxID=2654633 RepID=A0A8S1ED56_9PELO|nr:unnamed protein product [Caenorhabditis bovis]